MGGIPETVWLMNHCTWTENDLSCWIPQRWLSQKESPLVCMTVWSQKCLNGMGKIYQNMATCMLRWVSMSKSSSCGISCQRRRFCRHSDGSEWIIQIPFSELTLQKEVFWKFGMRTESSITVEKDFVVTMGNWKAATFQRAASKKLHLHRIS